MGPDQRASLGGIARLRREVATDRAALARHAAEAAALRTRLPADPSPAQRAHAAVALHAWYTGLESSLERALRFVDGDVPAGETWHRDILVQATVEVPKLRPPILPGELLPDLLALLSFRHFFRHAYVVELDAERLVELLDRLHRIATTVDAALAHFDTYLAASADVIADS